MKKIALLVITAILFAFAYFINYTLYCEKNYCAKNSLFSYENYIVYENKNSQISVYNSEDGKIKTIKSPYKYFSVENVTRDFIVLKNEIGVKNNSTPSVSVLDLNGNVVYKYEKDILCPYIVGTRMFYYMEQDTNHLYYLDLNTEKKDKIEIPKVYNKIRFVIDDSCLYYSPVENKYDICKYDFNTKSLETVYKNGLHAGFEISGENMYVLDYNTKKILSVNLITKEINPFYVEYPVSTFTVTNDKLYYTTDNTRNIVNLWTLL